MKQIAQSLLALLFACLTAQAQIEKYFPASQLSTVGAYYYPEHWNESQWERDLKQMAEMGFEFTHFAEFAWAQLEPEEGKYDFAWLDKAVNLAAKYNLKVIMCTSTATPPVWLVRKHPEVLCKNEDGTTYDHGARQHASFSSNFFRRYSLKMVEELAKHYANNPTIIGWQLDNEPRVFFDYNDDAQQRFRDWLKNKYQTISALNDAWGNAFWSGIYSSFDQINIPKHHQWGMNLNQRLDHYRFAAEETASFLDEQAKKVREFAGKGQWITSNYIPDYTSGYIGASHQLDFVTYTRYMVYGDYNGVGPKGYRVGDPDRIAMANDFFRPLSPVYGVMELQPGQVNWGSVNSQPLPGSVRMWLWHVFAGGSKLECTYRYRAPLYGYEQYHYGIVGPDGITPTPGGLEFQQFIKEINLLRKNYTAGADVPVNYKARKTGILFNVENVWGMDMNKQTSAWNSLDHFMKYYRPLKQMGAPVDFIRDTTDFSKYPVIIAPAYQQIDQTLIDKLSDYVKNGGNLVMSCRSGYKDREMHLWEVPFAQPIWSLIGAEIPFYDLPNPQAPDHIAMDGKNFPWASWGDILKPATGTECWATYQGDYYAGNAAVTFRKLYKGTVTYIGADTRNGDLEKNVLAKLYKKINIPVENYPYGIQVEYRDGFGIAMNYSDKDFDMPLPPGARILIGEKKIKTAGVLVWKINE
jgi:beta-galactosidase